MDLQKLQAMGAFTPTALFKRDITIRYRPLKPAETWADPDVPEHEDDTVEDRITAFIRKRSTADFLAITTAPEADRALMSILLCVCKEDGSRVFDDLEQVRRLQPWFSIPLLTAVNEVNTYSAKKLMPRGSSGSGSRSPSAAGASRSGRKRSRKKS